MSGMAGGSARSSIVVELECLHAIAELLLLCEGSIALRLDLSFALAVGRLGLLEDIDNVLALCRHSLVDGHVNVHTGGGTHTADNLARLVDDGDGFSDAHDFEL